ncbi:MAG: ABC transporter substrate-binding protein [Chloroflexi bacterium]|nr:ABC transporter substrate-binding protein [Chloroflexota bacterium]
MRSNLFTLIALGVFVLAGCGGAIATDAPPDSTAATPAPAEPTQTTEPDTVVLAINPQFSNAPFFVAMEEGYFAEQNINIVTQDIQSTSEALALVVSGDLEVVSGAISAGLINLLASEPDVRVVTNKGYSPEDGCLAPAMFVRRDLAESGALDSAETVRGLKLAGRVSSFAGFTYEGWLKNDYGLSLDDIILEDVPQDALIDALANGAIDGGTATEPLLTHILDSGNAVIFKSYGQLLPDMEYSYVLFGKRLTTENRDLGNRFMVAYLKAVRQLYNEGKSDHNIEILAAATGLDPELIARMCWLNLKPTGEINFATVQTFQEWALPHDLIDRMLTEEEYWDSGFVEYANQVLGAP